MIHKFDGLLKEAKQEKKYFNIEVGLTVYSFACLKVLHVWPTIPCYEHLSVLKQLNQVL